MFLYALFQTTPNKHQEPSLYLGPFEGVGENGFPLPGEVSGGPARLVGAAWGGVTYKGGGGVPKAKSAISTVRPARTSVSASRRVSSLV